MNTLEIKINSFLIDINNILDNLDELYAEDLNNKINNLQNIIQELIEKYTKQDEINKINQLDENLNTLLSILNQY